MKKRFLSILLALSLALSLLPGGALAAEAADGGEEDLLLHVRGLTEEEKAVLLDGCLMNYYAARAN